MDIPLNSNNKIIRSPICSLAYSLNEQGYFGENPFQIAEMITAYLNQYHFVMEVYEKLEAVLIDLNSSSFHKDEITTLTEFDIRSLSAEPYFRQYAHLLITSLKTLVDLFICMVDICQNKVFRVEYRLPDFNSYGKRMENDVPQVITALEELRNDKDCWINIINHLRNRIIHRGYLIKPVIGFEKLEKLIVKTYKGNNYYIDIDEIDIGNLFSDFVSGLPLIEQRFTDILLNAHTDCELSHEVYLKYDELIAVFCFNQIKLLD